VDSQRHWHRLHWANQCHESVTDSWRPAIASRRAHLPTIQRNAIPLECVSFDPGGLHQQLSVPGAPGLLAPHPLVPVLPRRLGRLAVPDSTFGAASVCLFSREVKAVCIAWCTMVRLLEIVVVAHQNEFVWMRQMIVPELHHHVQLIQRTVQPHQQGSGPTGGRLCTTVQPPPNFQSLMVLA
jgi:hypothetical protein